MPVTVKLSDLKRAFDVTSYLIRNGKGYDYMPVLGRIHITRTTSGLILEATDRYAILRAHVPVEDSKQKLDSVLVTPRAITKALSMLTEAWGAGKPPTRHLDVTLSTKKRESGQLLTLEALGFPVTVPTYDGKFPPLGKLFEDAPEDFEDASPIGINPRLMQSVLRVQKYGRGEPMVFTRGKSKQVSSADLIPIHFTYSDWAVGIIMPMRHGDEGRPSWAVEGAA